MKIPDGNKPIQVGDPSFIYKGVYHPITWIGKEPYRPRVEMLVLKDARYVYLRLKDDIEQTPPDKRNFKYRIPGGSIDADSSKPEQAIAETNEEALVNVTLVYNSGISYYSKYEPGFLLKGGDMPLEYAGSISDVFVGVYDGPYDKSKVEEKDLDDDMANHGQFYEIGRVAKYLRREHIEALIQSPFVATTVKTVLQIYRSDAIGESVLVTEAELSGGTILVPEGKLYHGSTYDIELFEPMSLDLGNAYQEPGWSTFCFGEYDHAKLFAAAKAFSELLGESAYEEYKVVFVNGYLVMSKQCFEHAKEKDLLEKPVKFYVYTIDANKVNVQMGNDSALPEYTFRDSGIPYESKDLFELSMMDIKELIEITEKSIQDLVYPKSNAYKDFLVHDYRREEAVLMHLEIAKKNGELKPGDDVKKYMDDHGLRFESEDIHVPDFSLDIDEPVLEGIGDISMAIMEKKYPNDVYGLPERKAYPMPDEKHVRSAIRFFNYAKEGEEEELARNINKKIRKFKVKDIHVGKKNRFHKYYQPINEAYTLDEYAATLRELIVQIDNTTDPKQKYDLSEKGKSVFRMLMTQIENGDFAGKLGPIKQASLTGIENDGFDTPEECLLGIIRSGIAGLDSNQIEYMSQMESSDIHTLNLHPIMEADDEEGEEKDDKKGTRKKKTDDKEEETAEDTNDEDDEDKEDGENNKEDEEEENTKESDDTDDGVTDYTAMADDAGAEDDTEPEGATDYTAMADDAGAEDDNEPEPEPEPESKEDPSTDDEPTEPEESQTEDTGAGDEATDYTAMADDAGAEDDTEPEPDTDDTSVPDDTEDADAGTDTNMDDEATDYTAMADEGGADDTTDTETGDDTGSSDDTDTDTEDTTSEEDDSENSNRYNNKEVKNYFLLNSFLSMHQTVLDVLDTVNGVVLPTPEANTVMAQVVKNLQSVKTFIEKFIQFQFSDTDYAFNLYYYNILMNALRMNLKLLETAMKIGGEDAKIKNKKEE